MYSILLALHSATRWLVLLSIILVLYRSYNGLLTKRAYTQLDDRIRHIAATILHIQMTIGIWLYIISPVTTYFLHHFKQAVHMREIRFFGMEHAFMMLTGVVIVSIGSAKAKRLQTDSAKFKTQAVWFTIGLVVILSSIPWAFSPLTHRPWFRSF
jgi:putative Ca2+/H+ antiporter (TMEM165/GDT1 family)